MVEKTIDGSCYLRMLLGGAAKLAAHKEELNALNVFPVCDGDTGTNMSMTISNASKEVSRMQDASVGDVANTVASALLRGARGNSGVILSLIFRGFAKGMPV